MRSLAELRDEREPGDERADDRRELGRVGELGERERERQRQRDQRARRLGEAIEELEEAGRQLRTERRGHHEEPDGDEHDDRDVEDRHGPF